MRRRDQLRRALAQAIAPRAPTPQPAPTEAVRKDSVVQRWVDRVDALRNTLKGFGYEDPVNRTRPELYWEKLTFEELTAIWRANGLGRRFVSFFPEEATRKAWSVQVKDGEGDADAMQEEDERLGIVAKVAEVDTWGRLYGGAWLLMVTDEDTASMRLPLDLRRVNRLVNLVVLGQAEGEVQAQTWEGDVKSPRFREPKTYMVTPAQQGAPISFTSAEVHASRLLYFPGAKLPILERMTNSGVDDSVLQYVWDQVRNLGTTSHALAAIATEMRTTVLKMQGMGGPNLGNDAEVFRERMRLLAEGRSVLNLVLLAEGEDYTHHTGTVSGMAEITDVGMRDLQAVTGMPERVWRGDSPGGLNTDGQSWQQLLSHVIAAYQVAKYREPLKQLYTVLFAARQGPWNGEIPANWGIIFNAIDELTKQGEANLYKTLAEADGMYIDRGTLSNEEVRAHRFSGGEPQVFPVVDQDTEAPDVDLNAILAAMAGEGVPGTSSPAQTQQGPSTDRILEDRRRLAAEMTREGVFRCEHGSTNRCRLCGVERRRSLAREEDGSPKLTEDGDQIWDVIWAALDDYDARADIMERTYQLIRDHDIAPLRAMRWSVREYSGPPRAWSVQDHLAPSGPMTRADADKVGIWIGIPLPEDARKVWEETRLEVAAALQVSPDELDMRGHDPHLTVLWVGKVEPGEVASTQALVEVALDKALLATSQFSTRTAAFSPIRLTGMGVDSFAPSSASEGDTPVFLDLASRTLRTLHDALARELLTDEEREQRPWYWPHATLGYLSRDLGEADMRALWGVKSGHGEWLADRVELRVGREVVGTWLLGSK